LIDRIIPGVALPQSHARPAVAASDRFSRDDLVSAAKGADVDSSEHSPNGVRQN